MNTKIGLYIDDAHRSERQTVILLIHIRVHIQKLKESLHTFGFLSTQMFSRNIVKLLIYLGFPTGNSIVRILR